MAQKIVLFGVALATIGVLLPAILDRFGIGHLSGIVIVGGVLIYLFGGILFALSLLIKLITRYR
jgi:hypothetical protein